MIIASRMVEMVEMTDERKAVWQLPSSLWVVVWQIAYTFHFFGDCTPEMKSEIWHQIARKKNTEYGIRCGSIGTTWGTHGNYGNNGKNCGKEYEIILGIRSITN
jgi:hypothetical protein